MHAHKTITPRKKGETNLSLKLIIWPNPSYVAYVPVMFTSDSLVFRYLLTLFSDSLSEVNVALLLALFQLSPRQPNTRATNSTRHRISLRCAVAVLNHNTPTFHILPQQQIGLIKERRRAHLKYVEVETCHVLYVPACLNSPKQSLSISKYGRGVSLIGVKKQPSLTSLRPIRGELPSTDTESSAESTGARPTSAQQDGFPVGMLGSDPGDGTRWQAVMATHEKGGWDGERMEGSRAGRGLTGE